MRTLSNETLEKVKEFVYSYIEENGYSPAIRDICAGVPIKSTATAYKYIEALESKGDIKRSRLKTRAINVDTKLKRDEFENIPLVGKVAAGVPITAIENIEDSFLLPTKLWSGEHFMLTVSGTSMINAGIMDGDKIIVEQTPYAENNDIVVAMIDDSATVKRFFKRGNQVVLHPENDALSDIIIGDDTPFEIVGKVVGLLRKF